MVTGCTLVSLKQRRLASTLVVADHDNATVSAGTLSAITAAQKLGGATVLVAGHGCGKAAEHAGRCRNCTAITPSQIGHCGAPIIPPHPSHAHAHARVHGRWMLRQ